MPAALAALLLALLRGAPWDLEPVVLLAKALRHPVLANDLLVHAQLVAPYTWAPRLVAQLLAHLPWDPDLPAKVLSLVLAVVQIALTFQLAYAATGSLEAAFLVALFAGADMPLVGADGPYNVQGLRRALGVPPLLGAMIFLFQGRRWPAFASLAASTYLHATPAVYLWPWFFLEDAWSFWSRGQRPGVVGARLLVSLLSLLPLYLRTRAGALGTLDGEFLRMNVEVMYPWYIAGFGGPSADWLLLGEGAVLILLALGALKPEVRGTLLRALAVCLGLLLFGTLSFEGYARGWPPARLWLFGAQLQPWLSLYLLELVGQVALSAWAVSWWKRGETLAFLAPLLLASAAWHDFVARFFLLALAAALELGRKKQARILAGTALVLPLALVFRRPLASLFHLRGIFQLPAFQPGFALALGAAWLVGRRERRAFLVVAAASFLAVGLVRWRREPPSDAERMAAWIKANTPADAVVAVSPLYAAGDNGEVFMSRAERPLTPCPRYANSALMYGAWSAPMAGRLRSLGFDFAAVRSWGDYLAEIVKADKALDARTLREAVPEASYLISVGERPWAGRPVRVEGELTLYRTASR